MGETGLRAQIRRAARETPSERDRYMDFLRAFSICVVVLGHWLIAIIEWKGGRITGRNALDELPGLWLATWILQVMPVFFFVGGFSNAVTLKSMEERRLGYTAFISRRLERLMGPTLVLLAVWIPIVIVADLIAPLSDRALDLGTELLTRPLWFIGIYLITIGFAPMMLQLHKRYGARVLLFMAGGALLVDAIAIGANISMIGYLNFGFVWLLIHQLGFFYADGSLERLKRPFWMLMGAASIVLLVVVTALAIYSASMVGLRNERSNTNPPTVAILLLTGWQLSLVMLLKTSMTKWLQRVGVWSAVIFLNLVIMTLFLWHQSAMITGVAVLYPLGFPQLAAGSASWWLLRPVWVMALAAVLSLFVAVFGRFEMRRPRTGIEPGGVGVLPTIIGLVFVVFGVLGFAITGFDRFLLDSRERLVFIPVSPIRNLIFLLAGLALISLKARATRR